MDNFWVGLGSGVISSILAAGLVYLFKAQVSGLINFIFLKVFPSVKGKWTLDLVQCTGKEHMRDILTLSQFANRVTGVCQTYDGDKLVCEDKITGKVTPSRAFIFTFETVTQGHHNYGSALVKINADSTALQGHMTTLCFKCQDTTSKAILAKKI